MQSGLSTYKTVPSSQYASTQQAEIARINTISSLLVILLPIVVVGAIVSYRKHQTWVQRRRIQRLNRLWQLDSSQKLS